MLIPATPSLGNKVICRYSGFTFQTFVLNYESIILSSFLKGFPFQLSMNANHTPSYINIISGHKSNRKVMNRNWSNQKANPALKTKAGNK